MQTMLLTLFFNDLLQKMREGKHQEVINDLEAGVKALDTKIQSEKSGE